jgi:hypothetical protein
MWQELAKFMLAEAMIVGGFLLMAHLISSFKKDALEEKRRAVRIEKKHRARQKRIAESAERQLVVDKFNKIAAENEQLERRLVWKR